MSTRNRHGLWRRWTHREEDAARRACAEILAERQSLTTPSADGLRACQSAGDWALVSAAATAQVTRQATLDQQLAEQLAVWRSARTALRQVLRVEQRQVERELRRARRHREEGDPS